MIDLTQRTSVADGFKPRIDQIVLVEIFPGHVQPGFYMGPHPKDKEAHNVQFGWAPLALGGQPDTALHPSRIFSL